MKVRGHRNRAKLAARLTHHIVIPYAVLVAHADRTYTFEAVPIWQIGAHRIEHTSVRDGYGRVVAGSARGQAIAAEPPKRPTDRWSMSFDVKAEPGALDRLMSLFEGRESRPNAP